MALRKTRDELKKLNDKNLMAYFKAERQRLYHSIGYVEGNRFLDLDPSQQEHKDYLMKIKAELNTRGHVESK